MRSRSTLPILLTGLLCGVPLWANSLRGRVTDPSGAVVAAAKITIHSQATQTVKALTADAAGVFVADGLEAGAYVVAVEAPGFEKFEQTVNLASGDATIAVALRIAIEETEVEIGAKRSPLANSDANYRALRTNAWSRPTWNT